MKQIYSIERGALDGVEVFLRVAERQSFRQAADDLGRVRELDTNPLTDGREVGSVQRGDVSGQSVVGGQHRRQERLRSSPWFPSPRLPRR